MANRSVAELRTVTEKIFTAAGAPADLATEMADALVGANLAGHDSHGVIRIPAYLRMIASGQLDPKARPEVVKETATTALVDGKWTFGHVAAKYGTSVAIKKAKEAGTAVVSIVRCNHIGRLGQWASQAAAEDVIALVTVGGGGGGANAVRNSAAPFGGAEGVFSTNPISIGIPGGETPDMLVDFATTVVAEGKLQVARAKAAPVPDGCFLDKEGRRNTNAVRNSAAPFGGAEGVFSTNPISIGIPGGETPDMLVDFATTVVAEGKLQVARAKAAPVPDGCILDKEGRPTTNAEDFYNGGVLLPFGGHKGYALAMSVEMLCGAFTPGDEINGEGRRGGAVIWAVDAFAFRSKESYEQNADFVMQRVKNVRPAQGFNEVLIPGEPESRSAAARQQEGIPVADTTWSQIVEGGKSVGVDVEALAAH